MALPRSGRPPRLAGQDSHQLGAENAYNTDRKLLLVRNELAACRTDPARAAREHPVLLFEPIRPPDAPAFDAGSYLYFARANMERIYDDGRDAARAWLAAGPPVDAIDG